MIGVVGPPGIPLENVPWSTRTRVTFVPFTVALSSTGFSTSAFSWNCPSQRPRFWSTPPPWPGPKWKNVTSAAARSGWAGSVKRNCALRMAELTGTHANAAGRRKVNAPTVNAEGSAARTTAAGDRRRDATSRQSARRSVFMVGGV